LRWHRRQAGRGFIEHQEHLLRSARDAGNAIGTSAPLHLGFGDVSHFNRTFRRRYGATPSDIREAALGQK
jgi:AraC-like DNA-binding protein